MSIKQKLNSRRNNYRANLISEINVTPLVDVMLVLLIIFMITSPMLVAGINVDLPESDSNPISGNDEPLTVTMDKRGNVYIMNSFVKKQNLINKLMIITKQNMKTRIFVRGDKNISYGDIVDLVSKINSAGFTKVALITTTKQR